jgi:BED zinc finger
MSQSGSHGDIIGDESESGSGATEIRQSRSRKRSFVWNHFDDAEENMVVCKKCEVKFTFNPRSGTTHLCRHILEGCSKIPKEERAMIVANL